MIFLIHKYAYHQQNAQTGIGVNFKSTLLEHSIKLKKQVAKEYSIFHL